MKKLYFFLPVVAIPAAIFLMGYHTGSPGGRTGSPGDNGNTCTNCHTGTPNTAFGWITTNVPASGYVGGQTYTLTATGTHPGVVRFGFELTVEDSQGNKVGTLQVTDPVRTKLTNGNHAVTHTANGITPNGNSNSWSMNWVAPANAQGTLGIYAAFNAANGNGNTSGDVIYKSSIFISPYAPPPLLAGIIPDQADQGETFQATITGTNTNFTGNPAVSLSNSQNGLEIINATNVTVVDATTLNAQFEIPFGASPGLWDLHVNALSLSDAFTVIDVVPTLVSIEPDNGNQGEQVNTLITAADSRFILVAPVVSLVNIANPEEVIEASTIDVISDTQVEAGFDIPPDASPGLWDVRVDEMALEGGFTVNLVSGIDGPEQARVKVYPNPATEYVFIENAAGMEMKLYNIVGEVISSRKISAVKEEIRTGDLPAGIYFAKISDGRSSRTQQIVIN